MKIDQVILEIIDFKNNHFSFILWSLMHEKLQAHYELLSIFINSYTSLKTKVGLYLGF